MSVNQRLIELRKALPMKVSQFAEKINVPRTTLIGWENGKTVPIETASKLFALFPGLNMEWLLTGEGPMFIGQDISNTKTICATVAHLENPTPESPTVPDSTSEAEDYDPPTVYDDPFGLRTCPDDEPECIDAQNVTTLPDNARPVIQSGVKLRGRRAIELTIEEADPEIGFVDFYSSQQASAGPGREVQNYQHIHRLPIMRQFLAPWRPDQIKALEVRGDSMTGIGLFDRDIVLYLPEEQEGDGIYVIAIDTRLQVKRIEFDVLGLSMKIISENERYAPRTLTSQDEISRIKIEGKVIAWMHRHPY